MQPAELFQLGAPRNAFWVLVLLLGGCSVLWRPDPSGASRQTLPDSHLTEEIRVETQTFRFQPHQDLIGRLYKIRIEEGDTLPLLARNFNVGFEEIRLANPGVDPWVPEVGREVILPLRHILPDADRKGLVVNTAAFRLFYFEGAELKIGAVRGRCPPVSGADRSTVITAVNEVWTSPVGVGRQGWETPKGKTTIVEKRKDPAWHVPPSIRREWARKGVYLPRIVPPGPNNPLGRYALRLGFRGYLIHGTNKPYGVGMRVSHGCIRLYPEAIEQLFRRVAVGTPVQIVEQPYLAGWHEGMLYLQVYPARERKSARSRSERGSRGSRSSSERGRWSPALRKLFRKLRWIERRFGVAVDWKRVRRLLREPRAIPFPILKGSPEPETVLAQIGSIPHPELRYRYLLPPPAPGWYLKIPEPLPYRTALRYARMLHHMGPPYPARALPRQGGALLTVGPYRSRREAREALRRLQRELPLRFQLLFFEQPPLRPAHPPSVAHPPPDWRKRT